MFHLGISQCNQANHFFFLSSRSCQVKDWGQHRSSCKTSTEDNKFRLPSSVAAWQENTQNKPDISCKIHADTTYMSVRGANIREHEQSSDDSQDLPHQASKQLKPIWDKEEVSYEPRTRTLYTYSDGKNQGNAFRPRINFQGAAKQLEERNVSLSYKSENMYIKNDEKQDTLSRKTYLCNNDICDDLPVLDNSDLTKITVVVKANKQKHHIDLQEHLTAADIIKIFAYNLQIPFDKLKLIHKGKFITEKNIKDFVKNKAVFQAFGEKAESEEGLQSEDIDILMKQLSVDRNVAVKALKKEGDVVDAILHITNK